MSKEAILFTIDAGHSMEQAFSNTEQSRFKISMECLQLFLQQKIFNNSSHQIGLSLFGEDQNQDGNNLTLQKIEKPNLDFVRKIVKLSEVKLDNTKSGGDLFSAIRFNITSLMNHTANKKYNKRGFIFTNGSGITNCKTQHLKEMARDLRQSGIKLNIIPIDFMVTYDIENNQLTGQHFIGQTKERNANLLMELKSLQSENVQIFPASIAIDLYRSFRKRDVNPVALFKGKFQIAPNMEIDVVTYKAIRKQRLKSLSKYDKMAPFDPIVPKEKQIISDINYVMGGQMDSQVISKQNIVNAYQYGQNFVPMNEFIQKTTKIFQQKNLTLLGFVPKDEIPRQSFMGEVDIVVPQDNQIGKRLFSAFIQSMISLKKYAIARYIPRNAKNGVTPKMVALIPYHSTDRQMFYLLELPTIEGVRDYQYNTLKTPTPNQRNYVKELVQKMHLFSTNEDGELQEEVRPETTFNPYRQYFYQTLFHRALYEQNQIPQLDPVIKNYITPEASKFEQCNDLCQKIKVEFKLKVKELKKDKDNDKKIVQWIDLIKANSDSMNEDSTNLESIVHTGKKFEFDSLDDDEFSHVTPVVSFRKMITNNKKDLVQTALTQMSKYVTMKLKLNNPELIPLIIECCQQMRKACVSEKEEQFWDNWFSESEIQNSGLCAHLKKNGIGYINRSNEIVFGFNEKVMHAYKSEVDDLD